MNCLLPTADLGVYVDCDIFYLKPIEDVERIFGREDCYAINNAVLKLPVDCPVLEDLRKIKEAPLSKLRSLPHGAAGPDALTNHILEHGLDESAQPIDVFYPVHWTQVKLFSDPGLRLLDLITSPHRCRPPCPSGIEGNVCAG